MKIYKIPKNKIDDLQGFDLSTYTDYFKITTNDSLEFVKVDEELVCLQDYTFTLYEPDIDEVELKKYEKDINFYDLKSVIQVILNHLIKEYAEMSLEEPKMHERALEFRLTTIRQIKELLEVIDG